MGGDMMANPEDEILRSLSYDSNTGELRWLRGVHNRKRRAGEIAGFCRKTRCGGSYRLITVAGREHLAHRLAWLIHFGAWPPGDIDHINRDGLDNRIANLRLATRSQNLANSRKSSNNPYKGVFPLPSGRWRAVLNIREHGKKNMIHLGCFDSPEEAQAAYLLIARAHWGEYARCD
jgi:hypothetical protein